MPRMSRSTSITVSEFDLRNGDKAVEEIAEDGAKKSPNRCRSLQGPGIFRL